MADLSSVLGRFAGGLSSYGEFRQGLAACSGNVADEARKLVGEYEAGALVGEYEEANVTEFDLRIAIGRLWRNAKAQGGAWWR